jgi:multidrug efflux system outer membrane protein
LTKKRKLYKMPTYKKSKIMRKFSFPALSVLLATTLLSACNLSPELKKPEMAMPQKWSDTTAEATNSAVAIPVDWWNEFEDENLTKLIEEGLRYNANVQLAAARVAEARASLSLNNANLFFPTISGQGGFNRTSNSRETALGAATSKPYNSFSLAAVLDYELDLWGRLRNASDSAKATLLSVESNRDAVYLAVAADIANSYFNLMAIEAQIEVTEDTIKGREENYKYQETQFKYGAVNSLTYKQAESELASARAALPSLKQAKQEQESALSVLLGRTPADIVGGNIEKTKALNMIPVPPVLPQELPSTLLTRRPDIQAAEQNLVAANADVGAARADFFPRLSLSALVGVSSADADRLFRSSARNWQGGAALAGPLLDFGRTNANVDVTLSRKDQAAINYQQTIRGAFKDVVDSLSGIETSNERVNAQVAQTDARDETLRQAELRYKAGYSNYLEVLDAQRFLYQARLERIVAERDRLTSAVNLYKALGGGWQQGLEIKPEDVRDHRIALNAEKAAIKAAEEAKAAPVAVQVQELKAPTAAATAKAESAEKTTLKVETNNSTQQAEAPQKVEAETKPVAIQEIVPAAQPEVKQEAAPQKRRNKKIPVIGDAANNVSNVPTKPVESITVKPVKID